MMVAVKGRATTRPGRTIAEAKTLQVVRSRKLANFRRYFEVPTKIETHQSLTSLLTSTAKQFNLKKIKVINKTG